MQQWDQESNDCNTPENTIAYSNKKVPWGGGCYKGHRWDAGWLQVRRMIFGRDRTTDDFLDRKESFDKTLNALGDKIAQAAYEDGVI